MEVEILLFRPFRIWRYDEAMISRLPALLAVVSVLALPAVAARNPAVRVIAVQMKVDEAMYRDTASFRDAMDRLFRQVAARKATTVPTLVCLPEDVGLGLIFLGQWDTVKGAKTIREAGDMLGARYAVQVATLAAGHKVSPTRALLMVANEGWLRNTYYDVFSALAKKHGVFLAAGSAPLCKPGSPDVRNVAVLFGPDGTVLNETAKVNLIPLEREAGLDLVPGSLDALTPVKTPFGLVGTAVCWDGFFPDVIGRLRDQSADIVLQPSFNPEVWTPEKAAEWKTGLWAAAQREPGLRAGVNPMMVGHLFDVRVEGRSSIVQAAAPGGYLARADTATDERLLVVDLPQSGTK
jgi:predicted amidohydrolase